MSLSSSFHSLGPAYLNEQSPNVIQLLKEGLLSNPGENLSRIFKDLTRSS